jgi:Spy/CpxP family protein refolding chaperone
MHPAYIWWKQAQEARRSHHESHCGDHGERGRSRGRHHHGEPGHHGPSPFGENPFGGNPFEHLHQHAEHAWAGGFGDHHGGGGGLGVRRPLRFLAHKLDLREEQVTELAAILNELKTERAQAEVDDRRTVAGLADAVAAETFDDARAKEAGEARVKSAENLRQAVAKALGKIHALLDSEQRSRFAYLIRTGVLSL